MDKIEITAKDRTPAVVFDFAAGRFSFKGESYPEDITSFYGPLHQGLQEFLGAPFDGEIFFDMEFSYFNSSSAKVLMNIFQLLEEAAADGKKIVVNWHYHADDDTMQEFGEDFASDMEHISFNLCEVS